MSDQIAHEHIVLNKVCKNFPASGEVLLDINIKISKGDFVVLLGSSGSGKSTLLRLIAQLEEPSSGTINLLEQRNQFEKAFVFQEPHLMPWKTVVENVALPLELMGMSSKERNNKSLEALSQVGLKSAADLYPYALSGGMKMRASLARALVTQPKLLLLDEPFSALDEQTRFRLGEELRTLWLKHSMTIVFVTHSLHEACFLGERIIFLSKKPAQIISELKIDLPQVRANSLRTELAFSEQLKKIYAVVEKSQT